MAYSQPELWLRFQKYYSKFPELGLSLDKSRVNFPDDLFSSQAPRMQKALLKIFFFDNADPDCIDNTLSSLHSRLGQTLCVVVSKAGGTKEKRNGMLETKVAYEQAGLDFNRHAVAVTNPNSELEKLAANSKWLARFPMRDWVGGRTFGRGDSSSGFARIGIPQIEQDDFV